MVMIEGLTLHIVEDQGVALATVSYSLRPSQQDVWTQQQYRETIQLMGRDTLPGEDGQDDPIPGGVFTSPFVALTTDVVPRSERLRLPSSALDEDPGVLLPKEDEIVARVTLSPFPLGETTRNSNTVRRGGLTSGGGLGSGGSHAPPG